MSGVINIDGSIVYLPSDAGIPAPSIPWPFNLSVAVRTAKAVGQIDLSGDSPVALALDGMTPNVIAVYSASKIVVRLTCADGTQQAISVDPWLHLVSISTPYTAIDFTRVSGVAGSVAVFLGSI